MAENIKYGLLSEDIAYQENSIVSRQIIKKANGNITLFAFGKGESLTEHTSPFEAVVYIVEGEMEIRIDGIPYTLKTGEMIVMPADHPHGLKAVENCKLLLTMIK